MLQLERFQDTYFTWSCITNCRQNYDTMHRHIPNYAFGLSGMNIILSSDHELDI